MQNPFALQNLLRLAVVLLLGVITAILFHHASGAAVSFQLSTNAFSPGESIPKTFTCDGLDVSPQLTWNDPPATTQSFALIMDDPDAPAGTWVHGFSTTCLSALANSRKTSPAGSSSPTAPARAVTISTNLATVVPVLQLASLIAISSSSTRSIRYFTSSPAPSKPTSNAPCKTTSAPSPNSSVCTAAESLLNRRALTRLRLETGC